MTNITIPMRKIRKKKYPQRRNKHDWLLLIYKNNRCTCLNAGVHFSSSGGESPQPSSPTRREGRRPISVYYIVSYIDRGYIIAVWEFERPSMPRKREVLRSFTFFQERKREHSMLYVWYAAVSRFDKRMIRRVYDIHLSDKQLLLSIHSITVYIAFLLNIWILICARFDLY